MSELLSQLMTAEMQSALVLFAVAIIALYVLSIVFVARDAYARGTAWVVWTVVAIIPLFGVIAYLLLRPPLMQIDRDEQALEIALKQRQLSHYGNCSNCGYPVEDDFLLCPNCHQRLKNQCRVCGHALDPAWQVCPYCASPMSNDSSPRRSAHPQQPEQQAQPRQSDAEPQQHAGAPRHGFRTRR